MRAAVAIEAVGGYVPFVQEPDYVPYHQMPYCGFVEGVAWDDADAYGLGLQSSLDNIPVILLAGCIL